MKNYYDVLIIGAGPAGSSAASYLKQAGLKVCVTEKGKFPRFMIGESLLPRCMDLLDESGLLPKIGRQGYMEKHGAWFLKESLNFNLNFSNQWGEGWGYTYQVPRAHFDQTLVEAIQEKGVDVFFESFVKNVQISEARSWVKVEDSGGKLKSISAGFILDASGQGQVLPKRLGLSKPSPMPPRQSIFAHLEGDERPEGREEGKIWIVAIHQKAWMWVIPFSNGTTSVGVVGDRQFFQDLPGDTKAQFHQAVKMNKRVHQRLSNIRLLFAPKCIADYSTSVERLHGPGYALIGNAAGFLDPIFSNGITLALESSNRAAKMILRRGNGQNIDWTKEYDDYIRSGMNVFNTYISAWYDGSLHAIFHHPRKDDLIIRKIISILSGYVWDSRNPLVRRPKKRLDHLLNRIGPSGPM